MTVCIACGTENREKAIFCRGCATSLVALAGTSAAPAPKAVVEDKGPTQTCLACQTKNPLVATSCKSCGISLVPDIVAPRREVAPAAAASNGLAGRLVVAAALLAVAAGAAAWWLGAKGPATAPAALAPVAQAPAAPVNSASTLAPAPDLIVETGSDATEDEQAARARQRAAQQAEAERNRRARERREREARERAAVQQQRAVEAEQARRAAAEAAAQPVVAAQGSVPEPAPVRSVDQACAAAGNFISREVCRNRECRDPALASDPVCVRFREVEAANLRQPME